MTAIEVNGQINAQGVLLTDTPLQVVNKRVKIIILLPEDNQDISDQEWLTSVSVNPVFQSWDDDEDIYSFEDGQPLSDNKKAFSTFNK